MDDKFNLSRFLDAQKGTFQRALSEVQNGCKQSHWMWFVFPQLKGLGRSHTARFYGIDSIEEAEAYLEYPDLGENLVRISTELLKIEGRTATEIFGSPDDLKLRSCMTLFANAHGSNPVFGKVLDKYFSGQQDKLTLQILEKTK